MSNSRRLALGLNEYWISRKYLGLDAALNCCPPLIYCLQHMPVMPWSISQAFTAEVEVDFDKHGKTTVGKH